MNIVIPSGQKLEFSKFISEDDFIDGKELNIIVEDNSSAIFVDKINFYNLNSNINSDPKLNSNPNLIFNINLSIGKNSIVKWINLSFESIQSKLIFSLDGEGCDFAYKSILFANHKQNFDVNVRAIHNAPHTKSDILIRGVVDDEAKINCKGLVRVESNAPHSEGYQKTNILTLSDDAVAKSLPELEIENNDVKCSHGATVGKVSEENLFYLMSRGLSKEEAKRQIVEGFMFEVVDYIDIKEVTDEVKKIIYEKYNGKNK